ncbi:MAG: DUF2971 domain-containing protein [Oligoflexales bacterium]|nr:DUF2971 domain-containing protein [Oligoflexales bacterium]
MHIQEFYLYKYLSIDENLLEEGKSDRIILESIAEGNIKFALLASLNDPAEAQFRFESQCDPSFRTHVVNYINNSDLDTNHKEKVRRWIELKSPIYSDIILFLSHLEIPTKNIEDVEKSFDLKIPALKYRTVRDNYGVFCVSDKNNSALMWSHYCKDHKGICIEYKITTKKNNLHKVIYSTARTLPLSGNTTFEEKRINDQIYQAITTKFIDWQYENEWRLVRLNQPNKFTQLPDGTGFVDKIDWEISEVIFGVRSSSALKGAVKEIFGNKISYLSSQLDYASYKILPVGK